MDRHRSIDCSDHCDSYRHSIYNRIIQDTSNYLLLCAISIAVVSVLLFIISNVFTISKNDPREFGVTVRRESRLNKIFGDQYIVLLSVFLLISMIMFVFSQYSFQKLVTEQYPDERDLTNFNSFFIGAVYGISLDHADICEPADHQQLWTADFACSFCRR